MRFARGLAGTAVLLLAACASSGENVDSAEEHWDSASGNPTHATHSYMAEYAISSLTGALPEVARYKAALLKGANLELHELPLKDPTYEPLRREIGGSNWAADRPELLWDKARASYAAGDKEAAYVYVGVILHYVQDMGVPAHAFHVIHQSTFGQWDDIELLAFFDFHADMKSLAPIDPALASPIDYIAWSGEQARQHWQTSFPGETYKRTSFPTGYSDLTDEQWKFLREREAQATMANLYALRVAVTALTAP